MKINTTYLFSFVMIWFFSTTIYSQSTTLDSLKVELQKYPERDTTRVNLLNELAYYSVKDVDATQSYLDEVKSILKTVDYKKGEARNLFVSGFFELVKGDSKATIRYYQEALQVYQAIDFKKGISQCYDALATMSMYQSDYQKAIEYSEKDLEIREEIGTNEEVAYTIYTLGGFYGTLGDFPKSLQFYERALKLFESEDNKRGLSEVFEGMGALYLDRGNYPLALDYFNKSLFIKENYFESKGVYTILNNIGIIYQDQGNLDKALEYYNRSLVISRKSNYKRGVVKTTIYLGSVFKKKKEYIKALEFFNQALEKSEEINDLDNTAIVLNYIGDLYLSQEQFPLAYKNFKRSESISLEIGKPTVLSRSYWGLANTFLAEKKYKKALSYTLKLDKIADDLSSLSLQNEVQFLFFNIYKETRDYKKALTSHQQFKVLNDSLFNKENVEKIAQLEYEYKYKQQLDSASIRELKLTKIVKDTSQNLEKSQRNYLWSIIAFLLISMLLGGIIFYLKFRNIKAKTHSIIVEQKLLRSQMTPHFIFNSLSVLQGMILNKEEKKSVVYLSKFSKLLRIILENSRDKVVPLSQELEAVENYLSLQNLENESYTYTISVEDTIDTSSFEIPPMLIQPFVENAIEHAFISELENKQIDVYLKYTDKKLRCIITDNGIGIDSHQTNKRKDKTSLATTITSERLKILSKDFNMEGSVTIEDRKNHNAQGTKVVLVIPHKTLNV